MQKERDKEKNTKPPEFALLIREPCNSLISYIKLFGTLNNHPVAGILDTGARSNYICHSVLQETGLKLTSAKCNSKVELGNGTTANIIGVVTAKLQLKEFPSFEFTENFLVINGTLKEILLGSPFLNNNDVMIDYRQKHLRIVDQVLILNSEAHEAWISNPDSQILEKAMNIRTMSKREQFLARISIEE